MEPHTPAPETENLDISKRYVYSLLRGTRPPEDVIQFLAQIETLDAQEHHKPYNDFHAAVTAQIAIQIDSAPMTTEQLLSKHENWITADNTCISSYIRHISHLLVPATHPSAPYREIAVFTNLSASAPHMLASLITHITQGQPDRDNTKSVTNWLQRLDNQRDHVRLNKGLILALFDVVIVQSKKNRQDLGELLKEIETLQPDRFNDGNHSKLPEYMLWKQLDSQYSAVCGTGGISTLKAYAMCCFYRRERLTEQKPTQGHRKTAFITAQDLAKALISVKLSPDASDNNITRSPKRTTSVARTTPVTPSSAPPCTKHTQLPSRSRNPQTTSLSPLAKQQPRSSRAQNVLRTELAPAPTIEHRLNLPRNDRTSPSRTASPDNQIAFRTQPPLAKLHPPTLGSGDNFPPLLSHPNPPLDSATRETNTHPKNRQQASDIQSPAPTETSIHTPVEKPTQRRESTGQHAWLCSLLELHPNSNLSNISSPDTTGLSIKMLTKARASKLRTLPIVKDFLSLPKGLSAYCPTKLPAPAIRPQTDTIATIVQQWSTIDASVFAPEPLEISINDPDLPTTVITSTEALRRWNQRAPNSITQHRSAMSLKLSLRMTTSTIHNNKYNLYDNAQSHLLATGLRQLAQDAVTTQMQTPGYVTYWRQHSYGTWAYIKIHDSETVSGACCVVAYMNAPSLPDTTATTLKTHLANNSESCFPKHAQIAVLQRGESILIPPGWYHAELALSDIIISVETYWFENGMEDTIETWEKIVSRTSPTTESPLAHKALLQYLLSPRNSNKLSNHTAALTKLHSAIPAYDTKTRLCICALRRIPCTINCNQHKRRSVSDTPSASSYGCFGFNHPDQPFPSPERSDESPKRRRLLPPVTPV